MILNCIPIIPGLGTMISACLGERFYCKALLFGILQLILFPFLFIGYIWSIAHGTWLLVYAKRD